MKFTCTSVALLSAALVSGERLEERGERMALRASAVEAPPDPDSPTGFPGVAAEWEDTCTLPATLADDTNADYCYKKTLFTGYTAENHEPMANFVRAVCAANSLTVTGDTALRAFVKYFDEECDSSTYKNMLEQLSLAKNGSPECGGGWVKDISSSASASLLDAGTSKSITAARSGTSLALRRVHQSTMQVDDESNKKALVRIIKLYLQEIGYSVATLTAKAETIAGAYMDTDLDNADQNTYDEFRSAIKSGLDETEKTAFDAAFPEQADVEFTETDYTNVQESKAKMADFIYKKIDKMDLKIKNFYGLLGMVPWYTTTAGGGCGEQTYDKLTTELAACTAGAHPEGASPEQDFQCGGWIWNDADQETTD